MDIGSDRLLENACGSSDVVVVNSFFYYRPMVSIQMHLISSRIQSWKFWIRKKVQEKTFQLSIDLLD